MTTASARDARAHHGAVLIVPYRTIRKSAQNTIIKKNRKEQTMNLEYVYAIEASQLAEELGKLPMTSDIEEFGPKVVKLMNGASRSAFKILDEKPGRFTYMNGRYFMLRCVRNDAAKHVSAERGFGKAMFKGFV
jgi:hypothetical protein